MGPEGLRYIGGIHIIEHHAEEKDPEDHAIHMHKFRFRQKLHLLHENTYQHQPEQGHNRTDSDYEITVQSNHLTC